MRVINCKIKKMAELKDYKCTKDPYKTKDYPEGKTKKCGIEHCIHKETCNQIQVNGILKKQKVKCINYKTIYDEINR